MTVKRVKLKEKSPEFVEEGKTTGARPRACDMPNCRAAAEHKAPKDRGLREYYFFCTQHVAEYNAAWDFFEGMSQSDIERSIRESMFGDRPTWVYSANPSFEDMLRDKVAGFRDFEDVKPKREPKREAVTPESEALDIMGLTPPVTFVKIKERYRTLMKTHHPDRNQGDKESEEIVKRVNMAYTILKAAHEKYETLKKV